MTAATLPTLAPMDPADAALQRSRADAERARTLADLLARAVSRVSIRVNDGPDAQRQLGEVEHILRKHPGPTAISLTLCLPPDIEAEMAPLPHVKILPSEGFVAEVENLLGKGADRKSTRLNSSHRT